MRQKLMFLVLVLAVFLGSSAHAATIIWVSDNKTPANGVAADQQWVDLLEANGYTVDLSFRNAEARTLDQAKIDALNAADLIIVSRDTNSGDYDDGNEITQWNSLTRPLLLQIVHLVRSNRWKWLDTTNTDTGQPAMEVVDPGHPVFSGVTLGAGNQVAVIQGGNCSLGNVTDPGNGTVLAKRADNGGIWIEEWQAGVEFYPGSGQTPAGQRMYFGGGGTENVSDGAYNYTADGGKMFINAVRYLLGAAKREKAYNPNPEDGAYIQDIWASLSWMPGDLAVSHDVYVGENLDEVTDGTGDTFRGNQTATFATIGFPGFPYPDGLVPGTTYYWRIDEVNGAEPNSPWKGDVWSFKVPPRTAYNPNPADGAEFVDTGATLSWTGGFGAKLHTVYFGDDFDTVSNAAGGSPQGATTYKPAGLQSEKVYYWRVDEFDPPATHKGDVWAFTTPGAAGSLSPANGATGVQLDANLTWTPAGTAVSHDVYFGTDKDAVRNATKASPEFKGNKAAGSETYAPGKLAWHSDYYWRVDAVYNTGTVKGLVWNFTTADFLLVDDFESYNDIDPPDAASNRIFDKWIDGFGTTNNGALVGNDMPPYAEQTIVHSGSQAMIYHYDNNLKTSEAALTLTSQRDWTAEGVTKLSLWFRGAPANSAERMYVALNGNAVVYHDDTAATKQGVWTQWIIDLQAFADKGVNLANVNTITIGIGTKNSPAAGGTGTMYFDDIRLNR